MKILVVGANGKIGQRLVKLLGATEHQVRAMVRSAEQAPALEALGAETVVADLEQAGACQRAVAGCDAVVFSAGSGPHTGPDKTTAVDEQGAIAMVEAAEAAVANRFVMVSAMRTQRPQEAPEKLHHYLAAKKAADDRLKASRLNYTILRPGRLNDEPPTGKVTAGTDIAYGEIPRADVAAVVLEVLDDVNTYRREIEVVSGETPIGDALAAL